MANTLVQLRVESTLRGQAIALFEKLGLDLPTAIRMFLSRAVQIQGIPFSMKLPEKDYGAVEAMKAISQSAEEHGIADMSLDEINKEIAAVRVSRKRKQK